MTEDKATKFNLSTPWKIGIVIAVLLLVAGAIIYSVVSKNTATAVAGSATCNSPAGPAAGAPSNPDFSDLNWAQDIGAKLADSNYTLIFLAADSEDVNTKAKTELANACNKIMGQGVKLSGLTIDQQNPEYSTTISRMSSAPLPAVFLVAKNFNGLMITGDITETRVFQAFLTLAKACAPGSSSSCCP
jgi:hypothetical protein